MAASTAHEDVSDILQRITQNVLAIYPVDINSLKIGMKMETYLNATCFTATVFCFSHTQLKMVPTLEGCHANTKWHAYENLLTVSYVMLKDLRGSSEREGDKVGVYDMEYRGWFLKGPDKT